MYIKNKKFSLIFKILIVIIGIYGLIDSCFKSTYVSLSENFSYYTNLSNLLCIIFFIFYIVRMSLNFKDKEHNYYKKMKGAVTLIITVTMLVYNFILRPFMTDMDGVMDLNSIGNYIVHLILPIMVILDYLLFDQKGKYTKKDPLYWIILPFIYWIFICIRAKIAKPFTYTNSLYPYFFLDIDAFGIAQVIVNVLLAIILIIILGYIYFFIDRLLSKKL